MKIRIVAVGKLSKDFKEAASNYQKRISKYANLEIVEVREENTASLSPPEVKKKETQRLLDKVSSSSYLVVLDQKGTSLSSKGFARKLAQLLDFKKEITFIVGGSLGLSKDALARADLALSLSSLTFPHQLARVILLEQIYRAFKIVRGEPYHW